ncbi:MAG: hypothetical protein EP343_23140 [Deltaproteobacteria bacterium]|nr:MAG: hypothetical protein EP343_23140 [Deltaproteobacteria bacterium]
MRTRLGQKIFWGLCGALLALGWCSTHAWAGEVFANGGPDITGVLNTPIQLKGGGVDTDGDPIVSYKWTQYSGPSAELKDADKATATVVLKSAEEHIFLLTVSNGTKTSVADTVAIRFANTPNQHPTALVKDKLLCVSVGESVTLDATASVDPDGDSMIYEWRQLAGPTVLKESGRQPSVTFTPTQNGLILIKFTVSDTKLSDAPVPVLVYVGEPNRCPKEPVAEPSFEPNEEPSPEPGVESQPDASAEPVIKEQMPGTVFKDGGEAFDALATAGPQAPGRGCGCESTLPLGGSLWWLCGVVLLGVIGRRGRLLGTGSGNA